MQLKRPSRPFQDLAGYRQHLLPLRGYTLGDGPTISGLIVWVDRGSTADKKGPFGLFFILPVLIGKYTDKNVLKNWRPE
jgi:hypothetical protein